MLDFLGEKYYIDIDELEHQVRKTIFETNFEKIRAINADPTNTWKAGVNQFTD